MSCKIGIISDAHGNVSALLKCIRFLKKQKVDKVFFLGDAVGYMPYGPGVASLLSQQGVISIMGNHEAMLLGILPIIDGKEDVYRLNGQLEKMPAEWLREIENNGPKVTVEICGKRTLFCHGTPESPLLGYGQTEIDLFTPDIDIIVSGHTHRPHILTHESTLMVNPGSCGLPRDNGSLLSVSVLDFNSLQVKNFRLRHQYSDRLKSKVHTAVLECFRREGRI